MKRTLLFFFTLVVATMSFEDYVGRIADSLEMSREEVQACFNKTSVTFEDIMHFDVVIDDSWRTVDFDESALKMGCLFTCLFQKQGAMIGARINIDQMKKMVRSKHNKARPDQLTIFYQGIDTCADQVHSKINECEVGLKFILCIGNETKKAYADNNANNANE